MTAWFLQIKNSCVHTIEEEQLGINVRDNWKTISQQCPHTFIRDDVIRGAMIISLVLTNSCVFTSAFLNDTPLRGKFRIMHTCIRAYNVHISARTRAQHFAL